MNFVPRNIGIIFMSWRWPFSTPHLPPTLDDHPHIIVSPGRRIRGYFGSACGPRRSSWWVCERPSTYSCDPIVKFGVGICYGKDKAYCFWQKPGIQDGWRWPFWKKNLNVFQAIPNWFVVPWIRSLRFFADHNFFIYKKKYSLAPLFIGKNFIYKKIIRSLQYFMSKCHIFLKNLFARSNIGRKFLFLWYWMHLFIMKPLKHCVIYTKTYIYYKYLLVQGPNTS